MGWLRQQREEAREAVLAGNSPPDEYKALCERAKAFGEAIDQARLIASHKDLAPPRPPPDIGIET